MSTIDLDNPPPEAVAYVRLYEQTHREMKEWKREATKLRLALARSEAECERLRGVTKHERATRVSIWYMHDNHTFSQLEGCIDDVLVAARRMAVESPYGSLCPAIVLAESGNELRRVGEMVHSNKDGFSEEELVIWRELVMGDQDIFTIRGGAR
jgi:hypothetical protein